MGRHDGRAVLVVLGGLPGVGKSTVAQALCRRLGATLVRVDTIEQALRDAGLSDEAIGPAGYGVGAALAAGNLRLGRLVVADAVNAVAAAREKWASAARTADSALLTVELVCSDAIEHRRRVEMRSTNVPGLVMPTWAAVARRAFAPWPAASLRIDTARLAATEAAALIETTLRSLDGPGIPCTSR